PESSSWIRTLVVSKKGQGLEVDGDNVHIYAEVPPGGEQANVKFAKIPKGALLLPKADQPIQTPDGRWWWRVQPHVTEVRYIPAGVVQVSAVASRPSPPSGSSSTGTRLSPLPGSPPPAPPTPANAEFLWRQAEDAERAGNVAEAQRLYTEYARATNDEDLRIQALNRVQFLRNGRRGTGAAPPPPPGRPL